MQRLETIVSDRVNRFDSEEIIYTILTTVRDGKRFQLQYYKTIQRIRQRNNLEILIIDDDLVPQVYLKELVDDFKASGFSSKYVHSSGRGRAAALNCGLIHAAGEYCFILDFDDMVFRNRILQFDRDRNRGIVGDITLYGGLYCFGSLSINSLHRDKSVCSLEDTIRRGMPKPHTFMVVNTAKGRNITYTDIIAGIDYRFIVDAYLSGLNVTVINKRVGIHFKYAQSTFSKKSRIVSQYQFIKTQIKILRAQPTFKGLFYILIRTFRIPIFLMLDGLKRSGFFR